VSKLTKKTLFFSQINVSTVKSLDENQLAHYIENNYFNKDYTHQIFSFFTELAIGTIIDFIKNHHFSKEIVKNYYEKYIKEFERNYELEDILLDE
jgi:hypothetical protein